MVERKCRWGMGGGGAQLEVGRSVSVGGAWVVVGRRKCRWGVGGGGAQLEVGRARCAAGCEASRGDVAGEVKGERRRVAGCVVRGVG